MRSKAKTLNVAHSVKYTACVWADRSFFILNPEREYLTSCLHTHHILVTFLSHVFVNSLYFFGSQALSLSACNNVNLFITAMEHGKHLFVILEKS